MRAYGQAHPRAAGILCCIMGAFIPKSLLQPTPGRPYPSCPASDGSGRKLAEGPEGG
jgi:hypothetical protein